MSRPELRSDSDVASSLTRAAAHGSHRLVCTGVRVAIAVGALLGLALGIFVGVTTDLPLVPEVGLALGALLGWLSRRDRA